jgi:hypothetical protein
MRYQDFKKLVQKHNGWIEGDAAHFPSVYDKQQFEREAACK